MRNPFHLLRRLRALFHRDALDREMDEEMRFHLEMQARENAEAGVPPDEATHLARRQFGHMDGMKERIRARRGSIWLESIVRDVRFAARSLRRSPGFTIAVVATLAIGIGLVTAIVNVSRQVLFPDLPFAEPERLVVLRERQPESNRDGYYAPMPFRFAAYAEGATSFAASGAESLESLNLVVNGEPHAVRVSCVTPGFFATLGASCHEGRVFVADEHVPGASGSVAVISHQAWTRFFNRDPSIVGKDIRIGDQTRRIVGILHQRFKPLLPQYSGTDGIYLPTELDGVPERLRKTRGVTAVARVKPGITIEQAQAELRTIKPEMPPGSGPPFTELEPFLLPLTDAYRERHAQPFRLFLGAAGFLYLIGCTAVANLIMTRTVGRRRELGVRLALGGGRRRIMGIVFTEAMLLVFAGAVAGSLIGWWSQRLMTNLLPEGFGDALVHGHNAGTIVVAALLGGVSCVLSGLLPAWRATRTSLSEALKEGTGALGDSQRLRFLRGAFVVLQGTLAVTLLIGAGLMIESVSRLQRIELGFDPTNKIVFGGHRRGSIDRTTRERLNSNIVDRLASLPEVTHAAHTSTVPLGVGSWVTTSFEIEGQNESESFSCFWFGVSPNYFAAMGLPLIAGSGFAGLHPGDRKVAMIDEKSARELFPHEGPIGKFITYSREPHEIVGVVRSVAVGYRGMMAFTAEGTPLTRQLYTPIWQSAPRVNLSVVLNVRRQPGPDFAANVRQAIYEIDPSVVVSLRPFAQFIDEQMRPERHTRTMLQILSGLALMLAAFGMFSVMAYTVTQRRAELGLRMVLGATPGRLVAFVLQRGLRLALVGIALGVSIALALTRLMGSLLYETSPHEPAVFVRVAIVLLLVAAMASYLPARRAAKIDPAIMLRAE